MANQRTSGPLGHATVTDTAYRTDTSDPAEVRR
jgi:hypothetical protein